MTVEEYIKKYTKKCSNTISNARGLFSPWLTPYHAGEIAKMAKEEGKKEILDKVKSLIKEWELGTSAEAKYKVEAYKDLMEIIEIKKEDKE